MEVRLDKKESPSLGLVLCPYGYEDVASAVLATLGSMRGIGDNHAD